MTVKAESNSRKNNKKYDVKRDPHSHLNLYWLTNAIAIYFPDNMKREISVSLIDLHCRKEKAHKHYLHKN